jgi:HEAT repeat protein
VDWEELAKAVALLRGPLDAESQDRLLEEIRAGNRLGAVRVFEALHDGTIVPNLFDLLDDPDLPAPARQAVLQALYSIPGADGGEVVRGLESRITGDPRGDMSILRAIAMRGGREGTRALIEHVQRTKDLQRVPAYVLQGLDLEREPGGGTELVAEALRTSAAPNVLRALLDMAARPGVEGLAEPLIALDREGMPDDIRQQALLSLARNGTDTAVRHLLGVSSQPDAQGEMAVRALGSMQNATLAARDELLRALQTADRSPRPDVARQNLLLALGSLKHIPALPEMAASLRSTVPQVRLAAVRGLGHLGAPARVHAGELVGLYADGDDTLKRHVIMALGTIGGETAASALGQIRSDPKVPASIRRTADAAWQQVVGELEQPDVDPSESADPTLVGSPSPGGSVPSR